MSNKQSSIDTAIEQIYQKLLDSTNPNAATKRGGEYRIGLRAAIDILAELKEMHKQEMIEFSKKCLIKSLDLDLRTAYYKIEQYYNETFE